MAARNVPVINKPTCGICQRLYKYTRQKKLPCGHTFCHFCLQRFAGDRVAFPCPVCRELIELLPGGVSHLPNKNHKFHILVGELSDPTGIAVSKKLSVRDREIFVAAYDKQYIQVFTFRAVYYFPTILPWDDRPKIYPEDIAMDKEGNLWVVGNVHPDDDVDDDDPTSPGFAVQYNTNGRVLRLFELPRSREHLRGVAVDTKRNYILVTHREGDIPTGAVLVYSPFGILQQKIVHQPCQHLGMPMNHPQYITVDREGRILVTDKVSRSVYVFNQDGEFLFQFGEERLQDPRGICTDSSGNIIVADHGTDGTEGTGHVEMFDRLGTCTFLHHSCIAINIRPQAVAISPQGHLVVADNLGNELTIFLKKNLV